MFTESDSSDFVSSRQMGVRSRGGPNDRRPSPSLVPRGPAGRSLSSLFFSLGIRDTLVALTESPGLHRRIVAYLDDIVIFSTDPSPLDDVFAFFDARASSLHWNQLEVAMRQSRGDPGRRDEFSWNFRGPNVAIFGLEGPTECEPSSQGKRCKEIVSADAEALTETLADSKCKVMIESASIVGRKWLFTIPYYQPLRLSDFAVASELHRRVLADPSRPHPTDLPTLRKGGEFIHIQT